MPNRQKLMAGLLACLVIALMVVRLGEGKEKEALPSSMLEARGLCASQAIKLDDCIPKVHKSFGRFSPYEVHGKPITWNRIKEVVSTDPTRVMRHELKSTERVRDRLNSLDGKEIIEREAVAATKRRLLTAKRRLEKVAALAQERQGRSKTSKNRLSHDESHRDLPNSSENSAVVTAMATTMEAEQREIDALRKRLKRISERSRNPHVAHQILPPAREQGQFHAYDSNATCNAACKELAPVPHARCLVDCTSLADLSAFEMGAVSRSVPTSRPSPQKAASIGSPLPSLKTQDGREDEDRRLATISQKEVLREENNKLQVEQHKLDELRGMKAWTRKLENGGFKTLGYKEYGVPQAMKIAMHDKEERLQPQKLNFGSQKIENEMSKAGVSETSMRRAFGDSLGRQIQFSVSKERSGITLTGSGHSSGLEGRRSGKSHEGIRGGLVHEDDVKALRQVGPIGSATKARADTAVNMLIADPKQEIRRGRGVDDFQKSNEIKIGIYPGSARPLRTRVSPTSVGFWRKFDAAGVDVRK